MILPKRLKARDTIGFVAPSNVVTDKKDGYIAHGKKYLEELGFKVVFSTNFHAVDMYGIAAGTPQQRADDINKFILDKSIDAIWFVQGGSNANEVLDLIDYESIKDNPKVFLGMSDIDNFHIAINKFADLITFNSPDPEFGSGHHWDFDYSKDAFNQRMMEAKLGEITKDSEWKTVRSGKASGKILGCNINVLAGLAGTKYWPETKNTILFLESVFEKTKTVRTTLTQLKMAGLFEQTKGVVLGHQHGFNENGDDDSLFEDVFLDLFKEYDFPILKINEFGHQCQNLFLPIGAQVSIDADSQTISFDEPYLS